MLDMFIKVSFIHLIHVKNQSHGRSCAKHRGHNSEQDRNSLYL